MGTRSRIGIMNGNTCTSIYCHWDGYVEHNGRILFDNYTDEAKVRELISLGDMSVLRKDIGVKHFFSNPHAYKSEAYNAYEAEFGDMCVFYGRDRDETNTGPATDASYEDFLSRVDNCGGEYFYIFKDGVWFYGEMQYGKAKGGIQVLEDAVLPTVA